MEPQGCIMQQNANGIPLAVADFHDEPAAGDKQRVGGRDEALVELHAGGTGEERLRRFIVANFYRQRFAFRVGDVRWIRHDRVEGFAGDSGQQIGLDKSHLVRRRCSAAHSARRPLKRPG